MCWILEKMSLKEETGTQARIPNKAQHSNTIKCNTVQVNTTKKKFVHRKCSGCSHNLHKNGAHECPAWDQTCRKCGYLNHYEYVCHSQPSWSRQKRGRRNNCSLVSEISRNDSLTSNSQKTVPKQVLDIVDMANSVGNLSQCYKKQLQLDTLTMSNLTSLTQIFSNIKVNSILMRGKQDTGAEVNVMTLNVYDQFNLKLNGKMELHPCNDVQVVGYSKQSVKIMGKVNITCIHADIVRKCIFYMTDMNDTKILLGLNFCRAFNLVTVNCDDNCVCKKMAVDVINEYPKGLSIPNQSTLWLPPPVNIETKLRPDCKAHIMELFPDLFEGIWTLKDAVVKLDIDDSITPVVQLPRKIPQAMLEPLKYEIEWMNNLGVIRKLDINEATDWCHNLIHVRKPNRKLRVCLDPRTINKALRCNVHNTKTFQDVTYSIRRVSKISKIDANSGFWTLPMDEASQLLRTFNTQWGCYCFMKMHFGLNQAQYFFQYYMDCHFQDINSTTHVITDEMMIHGETDGQHDKHLMQVLNKCCKIGLKLNPEKCSFG